MYVFLRFFYGMQSGIAQDLKLCQLSLTGYHELIFIAIEN